MVASYVGGEQSVGKTSNSCLDDVDVSLLKSKKGKSR